MNEDHDKSKETEGPDPAWLDGVDLRWSLERDLQELVAPDQQVATLAVTRLLTMVASVHPDYVPEEGVVRVFGKAGVQGRAGEPRWTLSLEWETYA